MPPVGSDSVLDDAKGPESAISKKLEIWVYLIQRLGYPVVVSGVMAFAAWCGYTDIMKPVAATHIRTLDSMGDSSKSTAASLEKLATAHEDSIKETREQKALLQKIGDTQVEIKQVLKEGLKIQQAGSHPDGQGRVDQPSNDPPGTET